jgi:hypothetical protein
VRISCAGNNGCGNDCGGLAHSQFTIFFPYAPKLTFAPGTPAKAFCVAIRARCATFAPGDSKRAADSLFQRKGRPFKPPMDRIMIFSCVERSTSSSHEIQCRHERMDCLAIQERFYPCPIFPPPGRRWNWQVKAVKMPTHRCCRKPKGQCPFVVVRFFSWREWQPNGCRWNFAASGIFRDSLRVSERMPPRALLWLLRLQRFTLRGPDHGKCIRHMHSR